ncbi:MAG: CDP-alcohol phosphatidyltransferase family protein, partial [Thermomicrobia bacterium]|nr:CDP-alcohol phosphatidyltransferase family protein [Thermomicrobia bacterium]
MISNLVKDGVRTRMDRVGQVLARTGLTPDLASLLGLLVNGAVAAVLATGRLGLGGFLLLIAAPLD